MCDTFSRILSLPKHCWHLVFGNISLKTFCCFLSFKVNHYQACWGWKWRRYDHFCKKFSWTTKYWKNSSFCYKCNFHILCHSELILFFHHLKVETLRFLNMYNTYKCPSFMRILSFGAGRKSWKIEMLTKIGAVDFFKIWHFLVTLDKTPAWRPPLPTCGGFVLPNQKGPYLEKNQRWNPCF